MGVQFKQWALQLLCWFIIVHTYTTHTHTHTHTNPNPKTSHTTGSHALDEYVTRVTYSSNPQNPKFKSLPISNLQTQHTHKLETLNVARDGQKRWSSTLFLSMLVPSDCDFCADRVEEEWEQYQGSCMDSCECALPIIPGSRCGMASSLCSASHRRLLLHQVSHRQ